MRYRGNGNTMDVYMDRVRAMGISDEGVTYEEAVALHGAYVAGDLAAGHRLAESVLPMVVGMALKFARRTSRIDALDLVQEGNDGAWHAVKKYKPEMGFKFSTYAHHWIRQRIRRYLNDHGNTIRVPVHMWDKDGEQKLGRKQADAIRRGIRSLDAECANVKGDGPITLLDSIEGHEPDPSLDAHKRDQVAYCHWLLRFVPRDLRMVLELRMEGLTLEEIGPRLGVTRERIRQLELKGMKSMRMAADHFDAKRMKQSDANRASRPGAKLAKATKTMSYSSAAPLAQHVQAVQQTQKTDATGGMSMAKAMYATGRPKLRPGRKSKQDLLHTGA